jgi:hypothetical protein
MIINEWAIQLSARAASDDCSRTMGALQFGMEGVISEYFARAKADDKVSRSLRIVPLQT